MKSPSRFGRQPIVFRKKINRSFRKSRPRKLNSYSNKSLSEEEVWTAAHRFPKKSQIEVSENFGLVNLTPYSNKSLSEEEVWGEIPKQVWTAAHRFPKKDQ